MKKNYNELCSVLINSCDEYEEAWVPFFSLFNKFWPDCPFQLYLATQSKTIEGWNVETIHTIGGTWSERINRALKAINTPYVLLFLEDYFLQAPVKSEELYKYLAFIQQDRNVGAFYFNRIEGFLIPSEKYPGMYDMNKTNQIAYHLNCQVALWDKSILEEATRRPMSPWEFEIYGFGTTSDIVKNRDFYCSRTTKHTCIKAEDIFAYLIHPSTGFGISKEKWLWNNKKLFEANGIHCDFKTLGKMTKFECFLVETKKKFIAAAVWIYHLVK